MQMASSYLHVTHLIDLLRQAAVDNGALALRDEYGGLGLCLGAALANDAADALRSLLDDSVANELVGSALEKATGEQDLPGGMGRAQRSCRCTTHPAVDTRPYGDRNREGNPTVSAPSLIHVFKQGATDKKIWAWIDYTIDWNMDVIEILVGAHLQQRGFSGSYRGIVIKESLSLWPDDEVRIILR